jgi:Methane oxygenase PmoA
MNPGNDGILDVHDPGGGLCGRYHYDDPYKSFFRGLFTPKGCDVVSPPPEDHPHHKGLQYGLCAEDVNFWEEDAKSEPAHRRIGKQVTEQIVAEQLDRVDLGFTQQIVWQDDRRDRVCVSFRETRRISVQPTTSGYVWSWQTTLTAERDVNLVISAWPQRGGYCGLGLRLAPELFLKKSRVTRVPASGGVVQSIRIQGTKAAVTFEQDTQVQHNVLYIQGCDPDSPDDFAFVSLGPTNGAPCSVKKGETLKGSYRITVADVI